MTLFKNQRIALGAALSAALAFTAPSPAHADVVRIKEPWKELKGRVVSVSETQVILQTLAGEWLTLDRAAVHEIRFEPSAFRPAAPSPRNTPEPRAEQPASPPSVPDMAPDPNLLAFPDENNRYDPKQFVLLSRFKGQQSQRLYAGLYHFDNKGAFWIRLTEPLKRAERLQFALYGKRNGEQPVEFFRVRARFLDASGQEIGQSPQAVFDQGNPPLVEWFQLLEGVSGLAGERVVNWRVPAGTQTVEFRATALSGGERRLVGYLGNLTLTRESALTRADEPE